MTPRADNSNRHNESAGELGAYLQRIDRPENSELVALRERTASLPFVATMQGTPSVGRLLQFLIHLTAARNVLEVGVFTGCSTLAMATALPPDGRIVAIDANEQWAAIGREFWIRSGYADRIDLRIGQAIDVLDALVKEGRSGTFDLAFIDANKDGYEDYFERSLVLLGRGGVMVFDNILFGGLVPAVTEPQIREAHRHEPQFLQDMRVAYVEGLRRFNDRIARDERVDLVVLPMSDGVTLARKRDHV